MPGNYFKSRDFCKIVTYVTLMFYQRYSERYLGGYHSPAGICISRGDVSAPRVTSQLKGKKGSEPLSPPPYIGFLSLEILPENTFWKRQNLPVGGLDKMF